MRIIRFLDTSGNQRFGIPEATQNDTEITQAYPLPLHSQNELWDLDADSRQKIAESALSQDSISVQKCLSPIDPVNIFCIGLNYRSHAEEMGRDLPEHPVLFMKPTTAVTSFGQPVSVPACAIRGPETDYEVELGVIIGQKARNISEDQALKHVFGYCVVNDISARRWQKHAGGGQWIRGKGFDSFLPMGQVAVTQEFNHQGNSTTQIVDPQNVDIKTTLDYEKGTQLMQDGHTGDMIFSVATLVSYLSQDMTLLPGTVIITGTPPGVGMARTPPVFLMPDDEVTVHSSLLGSLKNPIVQG